MLLWKIGYCAVADLAKIGQCDILCVNHHWDRVTLCFEIKIADMIYIILC